MNVKRKLNKLWPVYLGEFINPEHNTIKNDLVNYFDEYIKKIRNQEKVEKIINFTKVHITFILKVMSILENYLHLFPVQF